MNHLMSFLNLHDQTVVPLFLFALCTPDQIYRELVVLSSIKGDRKVGERCFRASVRIAESGTVGIHSSVIVEILPIVEIS